MPANEVASGSTRLTWRQMTFILFMLALTILFVGLGYWQMQRLGEKTRQLEAIAERSERSPIDLPPVAEWSVSDPLAFDYLPVTATGTFRNDETVLVFTSLEDPRGTYSGPGYWVIAPLQTANNGLVFVNRGFVPQDQKDQFKAGGAGPQVEVTITGLARVSEKTGMFTPASDLVNRIDWARNIDRLEQYVDTAGRTVAPFYIDEAASAPGALPQGGETKLTLPNRHFEYALTWFSLAIITPILVVTWLLRARKQTSLAPGGSSE
ncbi:MAG: SURF1 family protein [Hyphomicrobiaceae bacterium]|nr:SURF1 family protein [Hyphomicrobiaceae bacterium]MCC0023030.1 SURF1 family protein [Hyphomicrobiaceae bacterium]